MATKLYKKTANADGHGGTIIPVAEITDATLLVALCVSASQAAPTADFFVYDQSNGTIVAHYRAGQEVNEITNAPF